MRLAAICILLAGLMSAQVRSRTGFLYPCRRSFVQPVRVGDSNCDSRQSLDDPALLTVGLSFARWTRRMRSLGVILHSPHICVLNSIRRITERQSHSRVSFCHQQPTQLFSRPASHFISSISSQDKIYVWGGGCNLLSSLHPAFLPVQHCKCMTDPCFSYPRSPLI